MIVGLPSIHPKIEPFALLKNRRSVTGSLIGGTKETQEMLDYCAEKNIVSDVEVIPMQRINEAYERMLKNDVRYRFVIDLASLKDCIDSCQLYNEKTYKLRKLKSLSQQQRENFIKDNGEMTVVKPDSIRRTSDTAGFNRKVSPENFNATYYQFTVSSFGWYNIDMLLNQMDGVKESQLFVRIVGEYKERINVFLIIPSVKVYGEGGPAEGGERRDRRCYWDLDRENPEENRRGTVHPDHEKRRARRQPAKCC